MDRLDYVSMMCNEHAYVMAIEKLLGVTVPERAQYIRVMFDEITRILNHLMWLGAHGLDIGAMTMFLYCFREREDLMDCYEAVSGARMHATYYRPGGVYRDLPDAMPKYQESKWRKGKPMLEAPQRQRAAARCSISSTTSATASRSRVDEYETLLTDNRIWKQRTVGIGVVTPNGAGAGLHRGRCCAVPASPGTCARSSPTKSTTDIDFDIPVGVNGDCYDRYLVRVEEMRQSNRIIEAVRRSGCAPIPGPVMLDDHKVTPPTRER
jgi:NADH-quinone oxidoreductase subunit D